MYGIEAINAVNGWSMAGVGILIVFLGLSMLSFAIAQIHRLVPFFERNVEKEEIPGEDDTQQTLTGQCPTDVKQYAPLYEPIIEKLGSSFPLVELYTIAHDQQLPHPHLTISAFRDAGILVPLGEGIFSWDNEQLTTLCG